VPTDDRGPEAPPPHGAPGRPRSTSSGVPVPGSRPRPGRTAPAALGRGLVVAAILAITAACGSGTTEQARPATDEVAAERDPGSVAPVVDIDDGEDDGSDHLHGHDHGSEVDRSEAVVVVGVDGRFEIDIDGELIEVTAYDPEADPSPEQRVAADELVEAVARSLERFADREAAERAGYRTWQTFDDVHMVNPAFVVDGRVLDPERPEFLMFDGPTLLGAMFLPAGPTEPGPQVGGPLTVWHFHRSGPACWTAGGLLLDEDRPSPNVDDGCAEGLLLSDRSPEMLHVWIVDNPAGPFASGMPG
jgi:hypothetical protein